MTAARSVRTAILAVALALYSSLFFITKTNLVTSDLGRHIMNGKLVVLHAAHSIWGESVFEWALHDSVGLADSALEWEAVTDASVLRENTYSYTAPEFSVLNHHWLFGVLMYSIFLLGGFASLTLFNALVIGMAVYLLVQLALKKSSWQQILVAAVLLLPLITSRTEIRPESLSILFCVLFFVLLTKVKTASNHLGTTKQFLGVFFALLVLQILWVNTHLFFILGVGVLGVFWLESACNLVVLLLEKTKHSPTHQQPTYQQKYQQAKTLLTRYSLLFAAVLLGSLVNPAGVAGVLAPFNIFTNYDFLVAENQSTLFMLRVLPTPIHWFYLVVVGAFCLLGVSVLLHTFLYQSRYYLLRLAPWLLYGVVIVFVGLQLNRFYSFVAVLTFIPLTHVLAWLTPKLKPLGQKIFNHTAALPLLSLLGFCFIWLAVVSGLFLPSMHEFGAGTLPNNGAQFFKENSLRSPVFNNYDSGGYLIFNLFPKHRVFTDNRPEAYPVGFFRENKRILADEQAWQEHDTKLQFESIVFHRRDMTDHGQEFLIKRITDPNWIPVFVDDYVLILVKNNESNASIIERFALPESIFRF